MSGQILANSHLNSKIYNSTTNQHFDICISYMALYAAMQHQLISFIYFE
jgi:hypothetical protein